MRNVFLYWEGKEYSTINILRKLIYIHSNNQENYKIHLLTDKNIKEYIEVPEQFDYLRVEHKADYIRVQVILKYGGIWLDSDTLVMTDLSELFEILETKDGFFIKEENWKICNGVFGANANCKIMKMWSKQVNESLLDASNKEWTEFGAKILNKEKFLKEIYKKSKVFNGLNDMYPIGWKQCPYFFLEKKEEYAKNIERDFQPLIILVNSVYKQLENKTEKEIIEMSNPLSYFIKKSIWQSFN